MSPLVVVVSCTIFDGITLWYNVTFVQAGILKSWEEGLRVNYRIADARITKILDLVTAVAREGIEKRIEVLEEAL